MQYLKKYLFLFLLCVALVFGTRYFLSTRNVDSDENQTSLQANESPINDNQILIDLDGHSVEEYLVLEYPEDDSERNLRSIKAYDKSGKEVAMLPEDINILVPMEEKIEPHRLDTNDKK